MLLLRIHLHAFRIQSGGFTLFKNPLWRATVRMDIGTRKIIRNRWSNRNMLGILDVAKSPRSSIISTSEFIHRRPFMVSLRTQDTRSNLILFEP